MEMNKLANLFTNGQELSDDMLDSVAGGVYTPEQIEEAKRIAREMGATEEQINEYEKKAKEMGLI